MLTLCGPKAKECYERAHQARQRALTSTDPVTRNEFLASEARWVKLAQSYELSKRVTLFLKKPQRFPKHPLCPRCLVPMWLSEIQSSWEKVEYFYECKVCEEKAMLPEEG